jgi:hypothetical protein
MVRYWVVALSGALVAALSSGARAQVPDVHFLIDGGASFPVSGFSDRNDAGFQFGAGVGVGQPGYKFGARFEGLYDQLNSKLFAGTARVSGFTANATYELNPGVRHGTPPSTPYLITGLGLFSTHEPFESGNTQWNFSWNGGAGYRIALGRIAAYVEVRYYVVSAVDVEFVPAVFGLVF